MQSILDPAYYSQKQTSAQPRVFVDRQGNMHDPDYRHFPSVSSYSSGSSSFPSSSSVEEEDDEEIYVDPFSPQARRSSSLPPTPSSSYVYSSPTPNPGPSDAKPRRCGFTKCHQRHSMDSYHVHESDEEEEGEEYMSEEEEERPKSQQPDKHSVKRQLQSVSLSLSVSAFRARRKVKEALHHHRS
ncbi:hypothetical protein CPB85DRAFT_1291734 [Mucidula mucida]|nr:hypothetical protein CPB85DRAFT_1291734 [Mucidula mucida]